MSIQARRVGYCYKSVSCIVPLTALPHSAASTVATVYSGSAVKLGLCCRARLRMRGRHASVHHYSLHTDCHTRCRYSSTLSPAVPMSRFAYLAVLLALLAAILAPVSSSSDRHVSLTPRHPKASPGRSRSAPAAAAPVSVSRPPPSGETSIHDPSGVVYDSSSKLYYQFGTGLRPNELLASHVSADGYAWKRYTPVFDVPPQWVFEHVANYRNMSSFWAPDILHLNGLWHLYYAVSSFGSQTSCIGLATNRVLDSSSSDYEWVDHGPVLCSDPSRPYNCIDPHIFQHPSDGTVWMNWGSYWDGIFVTQLTGHPIVNQTTGPQTNIAKNPIKDQVIEASWIQHHSHRDEADPVYWLFVNWGQCCDGVNSTYQVRYGKSSNISGPYVDAAGVDMAAGGGSVLLATHQDGRDRQVGPGQVGFPSGPRGGGGPNANHSAPVISYHFYDRYGEPVGARTLGQGELLWGDGDSEWPRVQQRLPA